MYAALAGDPLHAMNHAIPHGWAESVREFNQWMGFELLTVSGVKVTVGSLLAAIVVLALFLIGSGLLRGLLRRYAKRHGNVNQAAVYTIERLTHYLLLITGVLLALNATGIPIARFAVFAGAIGVGLGFGLQAIFNNFVSGLILLFERSLKVGDFVELASGVHGHVRDIHIRATRITTNDAVDILVPNSEFVSGQVVNWTLHELSRRLKVPFGVAYGTDKERVKIAALEAAAEVPFTLVLEGPRAPQVWLTGFGDSALKFSLVVWLTAEATRRPGAVTAAYYWALHTALEKHGIELPFPQRDLHIKSWNPPGESERAVPLRASSPVGPHDNDAVRDVERDIAEDQGSIPSQGVPRERR
jgi:small-conductance mechanosensitive channel